MLDSKKRIHMIGIGGAGMSTLAQLLLGLGHQVSGSDVKPNRLTERIASLGGKVFVGHRPQNVGDADLVVYSSAIGPDNPEIVGAKASGIPVVQRGRMLAELMRQKVGIAIAGTHGKTTTTSLVATVLAGAGLSPTVAIGAEVDDFGGGALLGEGPYFVAEADESDGSFLELLPTYAILTNIEAEHLDFYQDIDEIVRAFQDFAGRICQDGALIGCIDDENVRKVLDSYKEKLLTYGLSPAADIYPANIEIERFKSRFDCIYRGRALGHIALQIPGRHNILNALAAVGVGMELGIDFDRLSRSLGSYRGAARRFQIKLETDALIVIDDYAHHPTEVEVTLCACRNGGRRIIGIFQPHRYTRTKYFDDQFGKSFSLVDHLILTDIYPAGERPIEGVSADLIYKAVKRQGHPDVCLASTKEEAFSHVLKILRPGDMVVVLGAGDIGYVADELAKKFKR